MELRRHELVRLTAAGWRRAAALHVDPRAASCLAHWSANDLPAVVATQPGVSGQWVSLGVPAPLAWGRTRYSLRIESVDLRRGLDTFPDLGQCGFKVSGELVGTRVYGSFGWERLSGLQYVHEHSDLDLSVPVADALRADSAAEILDRGVNGPFVDGELAFPDGSGVAWREWQSWRAGRVGSILVRRVEGSFLATDMNWLRRTA